MSAGQVVLRANKSGLIKEISIAKMKGGTTNKVMGS